jgi:twitching motility protein PilT
MDFDKILKIMVEQNASDIFIRAKSPLIGRVYSRITPLSEEPFSVEGVSSLVDKITDEQQREELKTNKSCEFSTWYGQRWRFRVGIFYQRNTLALVIRKIDLNIPNFEQLNLPQKVLENFCSQRRGLILLTGITGSGKSTTIASMIEHINKYLPRHILTIEEPVEFIFNDKKCLINQREVGKDVYSYEDALKQFTVHSPDIIYIGNIRDYQTCRAALTAAETGVLVLSTIHTVNASSTIERIVNFFPPHQHKLVYTQLSSLLKGVISQRLIPRIDQSGLIPACEIMTLSPTISRLLRENKTWEIPKYIASGEIYGMRSFNQWLITLVKESKISTDLALENSDKREELEMELRNSNLI